MLGNPERTELVTAILEVARDALDFRYRMDSVKRDVWATVVPIGATLDQAVRCIVDAADGGKWLRELVRYFHTQFPGRNDFSVIGARLDAASAQEASDDSSDSQQYIVFVATAWRPAAGDIGCLNFDLCRTLSETHRVVCLVPAECYTFQDDPGGPGESRPQVVRVDAALNAFLGGSSQAITACDDALADLGETRFLAVVGHDVFTGELAIQLARRLGCVAALFLHSTHTYVDGIRTEPKPGYRKADKQGDLLNRADICFAVGPSMSAVARGLLPSDSQAKVSEFVPGIDEQRAPAYPTWGPLQLGIWGQLDPRRDVTNQGNLGLTFAAYGIRLLREQVGPGDANSAVIMNVFSAQDRSKPQDQQLTTIAKSASELSGQRVEVRSWGAGDGPDEVARCIGDQRVMLIPRVEDGFGLMAWQAIDAAVPLVLSHESGVAAFLRERGLSHLATFIEPTREATAVRTDLTEFLIKLKGRRAAVSGDPQLPEDLGRWSAAVLMIAQDQDSYADRAVALRQALIDQEYGWRKLAPRFAEQLVRARRALSPKQLAVRRVGGPRDRSFARPSAGSAAFEKLQHASRRFAERFVTLRDFQSAREQNWLVVFDSIVSHGSTRLLHAVDAAAARIASAAPGDHLFIGGPAGAGKSLFSACVYWRLCELHQGPSGKLLPFFLDCAQPEFRELESQIQRLAPATQVAEFRGHFGGRRPVLLIRGDTAPYERYRWQWFEKAADTGWVYVNVAKLSSSTGRADRDWVIGTPSFDAGLGEAYLRLAANFSGMHRSDTAIEQANGLLENVCRNHRLPLSYALAEICISGIDAESSSTTLSELLLTYCGRQFVRAAEKNSTRSLPDAERKLALRGAASLAHGEFTNRAPQQAQEDPDAGMTRARYGNVYATLSDMHPAVRHWLVASCICERLIELGGVLSETGDDGMTLRGERAKEICQSLNFVYPTYINGFLKEILQARLGKHRRALETALTAILMDDGDHAGRALRAKACYIVGRLTDPASVTKFQVLLPKVIQETSSTLTEIETLQQAVLLAQRRKATHCSAALGRVVDEYCKVKGPSHAPLDTLGRVKTELLLLQRSAYISLGQLGDFWYAREYVSSLLCDAQRDDLNRGFHLEYYGDVDYRPGDPLLSTDEHLRPCPRSIRALLVALADGQRNHSALMVPAVTLASLARHRHCDGKLEEENRRDILARLQEIAGLKELGEDVVEYVEMVVRELQGDRFVIERYVDDLYEIKFQRRTGWEHLSPPESVAAHSYMAEFLAKLFVRDEATLDRQQVLELIEFHDLAEAITGDIPKGQKFEDERAKEALVARQISQMGSLARSVEFVRLAARFERFEAQDNATSEVQIAKDCDRLDLLIQLLRYRHEPSAVPRYTEFRADVDPNKFMTPVIRKWASRFIQYFQHRDGLVSAPGESTLWPIPINRQRIGANGQNGTFSEST